MPRASPRSPGAVATATGGAPPPRSQPAPAEQSRDSSGGLPVVLSDAPTQQLTKLTKLTAGVLPTESLTQRAQPGSTSPSARVSTVSPPSVELTATTSMPRERMSPRAQAVSHDEAATLHRVTVMLQQAAAIRQSPEGNCRMVGFPPCAASPPPAAAPSASYMCARAGRSSVCRLRGKPAVIRI